MSKINYQLISWPVVAQNLQLLVVKVSYWEQGFQICDSTAAVLSSAAFLPIKYSKLSTKGSVACQYCVHCTANVYETNPLTQIKKKASMHHPYNLIQVSRETLYWFPFQFLDITFKAGRRGSNSYSIIFLTFGVNTSVNW